MSSEKLKLKLDKTTQLFEWPKSKILTLKTCEYVEQQELKCKMAQPC